MSLLNFKPAYSCPGFEMKTRVQSQNNYVQPLLLSIFFCPKQRKCSIIFWTSAAKSQIRFIYALHAAQHFQLNQCVPLFFLCLLLLIIIMYYFDNCRRFTQELTQFSDNRFPITTVSTAQKTQFVVPDEPMFKIAYGLK